jgi:hypothetical protein
VWVEGEPEEMSPRQILTGVAYSIRAGLAESAISVENVTASTAHPENTFVGVDAGPDTTGDNNTFIGMNAGKANTTANNNTFIGMNTGSSNTVGQSNTFIGYAAGWDNTTANDNTFIGKDAGHHNTSGNNNTFIGSHAGYNNTTGTDNVFLGYQAGFNETGSNKLYIDNSSNPSPLIWGDFETDKLGINGNVGIGTNDPGDTRLAVNGNVNISGSTDVVDHEILTVWNHGVGIGAHFVAEGAQARAIRAWATNTEVGAANIGGDFSARGENGIGVYGSADNGENGHGVLGIAGGINGRGVAGFAQDTTGTGESYGGWFRALSTSGKGVYGVNWENGSNTTVTHGYLGGGDYGAYGQYGNDGNYGYLGSSNWGVFGQNANGNAGWIGGNNEGVFGQYQNFGPYGVLGYPEYGVYGQTTGANQYAVRGYDSDGSGYAGYFDGKFRATGDVEFSGIPSAADNSTNVQINPSNGLLHYASSDRRLKTNIENIEDGLTIVKKLQGVRFNWEKNSERKRSIGLIAQDAEKVIPELTHTNPDGYMGINYPEITAVLIEAVKDQQKIIDDLFVRFDKLEESKKTEIGSLKNQLTQLRLLVETIMAQQTETKDNKDLVSMSR